MLKLHAKMYHSFLREKSQRSRFFQAGLPEYHLKRKYTRTLVGTSSIIVFETGILK